MKKKKKKKKPGRTEGEEKKEHGPEIEFPAVS